MSADFAKKKVIHFRCILYLHFNTVKMYFFTFKIQSIRPNIFFEHQQICVADFFLIHFSLTSFFFFSFNYSWKLAFYYTFPIEVKIELGQILQSFTCTVHNIHGLPQPKGGNSPST